jgi:hypothetical protein
MNDILSVNMALWSAIALLAYFLYIPAEQLHFLMPCSLKNGIHFLYDFQPISHHVIMQFKLDTAD